MNSQRLTNSCFFDQNDDNEENLTQNIRKNKLSKVKRRNSLRFKKCVIFKLGVICCLVIVFNLHTVMADLEVYDTDLWQVPSMLERNSRKITCKSNKTGEEGFCTFAIDCSRANGTHLGGCKDKFFFGSCCRISNQTALHHFIENVNIIHNDKTHNQTMKDKVHTMLSTVSTSKQPLLTGTESYHSNRTSTTVKGSIYANRITTTEAPKRVTTVKHNSANNEKTTKIVPTPEVDSRGPEVATTKDPITDIQITDSSSVASEDSPPEPLEDFEDIPITSTNNITSEISSLSTVSSTMTSTNNVTSESTMLTTVSSTSPQTVSTTTTKATTTWTTTTSRPFFPNRPFRPFQNFLSFFRPKPAFLIEPEKNNNEKLSSITMEPLSSSLRITTTETPNGISPLFSIPSTITEEISTQASPSSINSLTATSSSTSLSMGMADETTQSTMTTVFDRVSNEMESENMNLHSLKQPLIVVPAMDSVYESTTALEDFRNEINTEASLTHSTAFDSDFMLASTETGTTIFDDFNLDEKDSMNAENPKDDRWSLFPPVHPTSQLESLVTSSPVESTSATIIVENKSSNTEVTTHIVSNVDSSTGFPTTLNFFTITSNILGLNDNFNNFMTTLENLDETKSTTTTNGVESEELTSSSFLEDSRTTDSVINQFSNNIMKSSESGIMQSTDTSIMESTDADSMSTTELTTPRSTDVTDSTYRVTTTEPSVTGTNSDIQSFESDGISSTESTTDSAMYQSTTTDTTTTESDIDPPGFESELLLSATHHTGTPDLSIEENESGTLTSFTTESVTDYPYVSWDYEEICGLQLISNARVMGGWDSDFGQWPWTISLRRVDAPIHAHNCGAALINENWAVTAAHCVIGVDPSEFLLRLGEYDTTKENEPFGHIERGLQLVASHPLFDNYTYENDIALLRFLEPVRFQPNILPVCLPDNDDDFVGKTAHVTGWGRIAYKGPIANVMQEVEVPVITNDECENMYMDAGYNEGIPNMFICAGYQEGGFDSCEGDSGGPMVIERERDNRYVLSGIISWGIGCGDPNKPGVYTRISNYRNWINQIIQF